jgi:hypothetical protein
MNNVMAAFLLTLAITSSCVHAATISEQVHTVSTYLRALASFNDSEVARIARLEGAAEDQSKQMRGFERVTHTRWKWRIVGVDEQTAYVLMTESNDYYRLLGVGVRTQLVAYRVEAGYIASSEIKFLTNAYGSASKAADRFRAWLKMQPGGDDPSILDNGELKFNADSATRMLPWLRQWAKVGRP